MTRIQQFGLPVQDVERGLLPPVPDGLEQRVVLVGNGDILARGQLAFFVFFPDHVDDVVQAALPRHRKRAGGVAMGIDARVVVRARFHENADRIDVPVHHRVVNRAVFVVFGHVHVHQIGLLAKDLSNPRHVAAACRLT